MTSKQAIDIFKEKYPHKKPIGYWIDGENVILNTSPSLGLGYSEVCQYIVFADGKIQPTLVCYCFIMHLIYAYLT